MRSFSPTTLTHLQSRAGIVARVLVWVVPRDRTTGLAVPTGFWTGVEDRSFTIGGAPRLYHGVGGLLSVDDIVMRTGLVVQTQRVSLSPIAEEIAEVLRGHDARLAPAEIHRALFDPTTHELIDEPHRLFKGTLDELSIPTPKVGGETLAEVSLVSSARALTRTLAIKKSDETQRRRGDDRFRRYADVSASVDVWWGEKREAAKTGGGGPLSGIGSGSGA